MIKNFIEFNVKAIKEPTEADQELKGVKSILIGQIEEVKDGLKTISNFNVKSTVKLDEKVIGKNVFCEVKTTLISGDFGPVKTYYLALSVKVVG